MQLGDLWYKVRFMFTPKGGVAESFPYVYQTYPDGGEEPTVPAELVKDHTTPVDDGWVRPDGYEIPTFKMSEATHWGPHMVPKEDE